MVCLRFDTRKANGLAERELADCNA